MADSAFYFADGTRFYTSPRSTQWFFRYNGYAVGMGPEFSGARGFTIHADGTTIINFDQFKANGANPIQVGDRLTLTRRAGHDAYGISSGTLSVYRGVVQNFYITPGLNDALTLFLTIDADSDPLPNTIFDHHQEANRADTWSIIRRQGNVFRDIVSGGTTTSLSNQWHLYDANDIGVLTDTLVNGQVGNRDIFDKVCLVRAHETAPTSYAERHIGVVRASNINHATEPLSASLLRGGVFGAAESHANLNGVVSGAGGENAVITIRGTAGGVAPGGGILLPTTPPTITPIASWLPLCDNKTHLEVIRFDGGNAAFVFFGDERIVKTNFPDGFRPPLFRNFESTSHDNEGGVLVERYTKPKKDMLSIPLRFKSESEMLGDIADIVRKAQNENFLFQYRKRANVAESSPIFYGWLDKVGQPRYVAPTTLSADLNAEGYYRFN